MQFDTGMCRSGMQNDELLKISKEKSIIKNFKEVLILTHLASADEKKKQIQSSSKKKIFKN